MRGVNRVELIGYLGADPEVKYASNGNAVTTLSVGTSKYFKDKQTGERTQETEWHRVTCFKNAAVLAKDFLSKGMLVRIDGHLHYGSYEDRHGIKRYTSEVIADSIDWHSVKKPEAEPEIKDDIPF